MREITIIIIILILIIGGDIFINKYLENSSQNLIKELDDLKNKMDNKTYLNDELTKKANYIYDEWHRTDKKWAIIVLHSELDLIETSLIKMKTEIKEDNLDIAQEELETSVFLINHISAKEKFCLKNVF